MGDFGFNGGIPWATHTHDVPCFVFQRNAEALGYFVFNRPYFREHFDSVWSNLKLRVSICNPFDGRHITLSFLLTLINIIKSASGMSPSPL